MEWHARHSATDKSTLALFTLDRHCLRVEAATCANGDSNLGTFCLNGVNYVLIDEPDRNIDIPALSRREREIAFQIARGRCTKQIAYDLGISPHTTVTYVNRIRAKLGVRNRPELVAALLGA